MRAAERRGRRAVTGLVVVAALVAGLPALAQVNPLPPDKAFRFSARVVDAQTVEARFIIAEGYYLYRDKIHFVIEPATAGLTVPRLPEGKIKEDQFFGRVETYRGDVVVQLHGLQCVPAHAAALVLVLPVHQRLAVFEKEPAISFRILLGQIRKGAVVENLTFSFAGIDPVRVQCAGRGGRRSRRAAEENHSGGTQAPV